MVKDIREERKQRTTDLRKKEIVKVARKLVLKGGARAVSMRKVADEMGYSTMILYSLFGDKGTLMSYVVGEDLIKLHALVLRSAAGGKSAIERIGLAAHAYVDFGLKFPAQYALMFMEPRPPTPVEQSALEYGDPQKDPYAFAYGLMADLVSDGTLAADDVALNEMTQFFWEGIHGMTSLRITTGEDPWIPRVDARSHLDVLLKVLLAGLIQQYPGKKSAAALKKLFG